MPAALLRDHAFDHRAPVRLGPAREDAKFAKQFKLDEVEIIEVDGRDAGWLQTQNDAGTITLGQLYVISALQRRSIGTEVLKDF